MAALDSMVNKVVVKDGFEFDARGNPVTVQIWSYFIAAHGPFQSKFYAGEQQTDHITKVINDRVQQLRDAGALS